MVDRLGTYLMAVVMKYVFEMRTQDRLALRAENGGGHAIVKEGFCSSCDDKLCAEASGDNKTAVVAHDGFKGDDPPTLLPAHRCVGQ
jgi:hypothetical protein